MADRPARTFGVTSELSGDLSSGVIANSISFSNTLDTAEARDEKGTLLDIAGYSQRKSATIDGLWVGQGPTVGTIVSIGGQDYLVTEANKTESNEAFQEASVTAQAGDDDTVLHTLAEIQGN